MARPYMQKTIVELQEIFDRSRDNAAELKKLLAELKHRKVPKAVSLETKVQKILDGLDRPYIQKTIDEPEGMFEAAKSRPSELAKLLSELKHRTVPRATALQEKVKAAMDGGKKLNSESDSVRQDPPKTEQVTKIIECQQCGQKLRVQLSPDERSQCCPSCKAEFTASFRDGILSVTFKKRQQSGSSTDSAKDQLQVTLEDAYRLFNADPGTLWEEIELARRRLIQQYHPDKVAALGPKLRAVAEVEGKRINIAFDLIRKHRSL